jgi:MscS family membrane protein
MTDPTLNLLVRLLLVALIFLVTSLLRRLLAWILAQPLNRLLERSGRVDLKETIRSLFSAPARLLLLALALDLSARVLEVSPQALTFVHHVTRMLVIIAFAVLIYRLVSAVIDSPGRLFSLSGWSVDAALLPFVRTGIQLLVVAIAVVIVIQEWGYDVTGLVAGLGLGGLALSLAAQDTLSNLFGFTAMVGDRPFVVGDFVKTKDVEGTIEHVGLRSTRVRQINQALVTVPNSMLASAAILNWSRLSKRQIDMTVGISYEADAERMQRLLDEVRELLCNRASVENDSIVVYLINFGSTSLEVLVRCYINIPDWKEFTAEKEQILLDVLRIVNRLGLHVAVTRSALYIDNLSDNLNLTQQPLAAPTSSTTTAAKG